MRLLTIVISALLLSPAAAAADTPYKVKGDGQAMAMCKAVLSNDAGKLDQKLKRYHADNQALSFYLGKHDMLMLKDFSCNKMSLYDFSNKVGANNISRYLESYMQGQPRVYVEDIADNSPIEQQETGS